MKTVDNAAPCRHSGVPSDAVVDSVVSLIRHLGAQQYLLSSNGISVDEYLLALPSAIERLRGETAADSSGRRKFLIAIFAALQSQGLIEKVVTPLYGADTVYRISIPNYGDIAIIQKGCPDGAHSSTAWEAPSWAKETYLWWLCSSLAHEPGAHVSKGVTRLKAKFFNELALAQPWIDGVIFHNELCGGPHRPCPKVDRAILIGTLVVPPPCIYMFPERDTQVPLQWNWDGTRKGVFPEVLLKLFGVHARETNSFVGQVGFQRRGEDTQVRITSRFGLGKTTTFRR